MATRQSARTRPRTAGSDDGAHDPALPQKKRARHRLIGAIALCLLAAIVVPLLLESEPTRPVSDVALLIPSRETPLPPRSGEPGAADAAATNPRAVDAESRDADAKAAEAKAAEAKAAEAKAAEAKAAEAKAAEQKAADAKAVAGKAADPKAAAAKAADPKAAEQRAADAKAAEAKAKAAALKTAKADTRPAGKPDEIAMLAEAAQARARGEAVGRYLLQVGAFSGEGGAAAAVDRVQALGLPAFTERIRTDRGERVRVRVGPFASRESAEQARVKLKAAGVDAALIAP